MEKNQYTTSSELKIVTENNLRADCADRLMTFVNKLLPENKKISAATMSNVMYDKKRVSDFSKIHDKENAIDYNYKSLNVTPTGVFQRHMNYLLHTEFEKGGLEAEQKFLDKYNNLKGAKEFLQDSIIQYSNMDVKDYIESDFDKMLDNYIADPGKYQNAWCLESAIGTTGKLNVSPDCENLVRDVISLAQTYSQPVNVGYQRGNEFYLLLPEDPEVLNTVITNFKEVSEFILNDPELKNICNVNTKEDIVDKLTRYQSATNNLAAYKKDIEAQKELFKKEQYKENFIFNNTFTIDGKDVKYFDGMEALKRGVKVGIRAYTEQEKAKVTEALYSTPFSYQNTETRLEAGEIKLNKQESSVKLEAYLDKINEMSKKMIKTNSALSKDSQQFKDLNKTLNEFKKNYDAFKKELKAEEKNLKGDEKTNHHYEKLQEFYNNSKAMIKDINKQSKDYLKAKKEKNQKELDAGKELSSRSKKRTEIATEMEQFFKDNKTVKLAYDEIPQPPYRPHMEKTKVEASLQGKNINNEIKLNKELAKENEKEFEKINNHNN